MKISAIIPAAGSGERFGGKKQLKIMGNRPLMFKTISPFINSDLITEIVLVVPKNDVEQVEQKLKSIVSAKPLKVIAGGKTRQQSVHKGLTVTEDSAELICIHDAVRPFITEALIEKVVNKYK